MRVATQRVLNEKDITMDLLICSLCLDVIWEPVFCKTCENAFCMECICELLGNQQNYLCGLCPNKCHYKETSRLLQPVLVEQLPKLRISCLFADHGCKETLSYDELKEHESQCHYHLKKYETCKKEKIDNETQGDHRDQCAEIDVQCATSPHEYRRADDHRELLSTEIGLDLQVARVDQFGEQLSKVVGKRGLNSSKHNTELLYLFFRI
jgi:hypothetical protein